jgi:hypothetical protein
MQFFQKQFNLFIWLIFFMFTCNIPIVPAAETVGGAATETPKPSHYFVATYFHNTMRCPTCHKIENYSAESIQNNFAE